MDEGISGKKEFLRSSHPFRTNAFLLIHKMVTWCHDTDGSRHLVDEILHSIFFLGKINTVPFSPKEIILDQSLLDWLKEKYARPFEYFKTQLPQRSPFSCVLDMIVLHERLDEEDRIKQILTQLVNTLEPKEKGKKKEPRFLVSSTICVSKSKKSAKQYGVSMSTTGPNPGRIAIAASCLSGFWDEYVAGAVMTYYPEKKKKSYFDGTIQVPRDVSCKAYNIKSGDEIIPCQSCGNLFGLHPSGDNEWVYGNCAEAESLSSLFKVDSDVKDQARPGFANNTRADRRKARDRVLKELCLTLKTIQFKTWNGEYYAPQTQ